MGTTKAYAAKGTGYYPDSSAMEGGFKDRQGKKLCTLQQYLDGKAPYVSVAMDSTAFKYGTKHRIPELEKKYGRPIEFRVVDTGGAFKNKGTSRIDICTANGKASVDSVVNGKLTLIPSDGVEANPLAARKARDAFQDEGSSEGSSDSAAGASGDLPPVRKSWMDKDANWADSSQSRGSSRGKSDEGSDRDGGGNGSSDGTSSLSAADLKSMTQGGGSGGGVSDKAIQYAKNIPIDPERGTNNWRHHCFAFAMKCYREGIDHKIPSHFGGSAKAAFANMKSQGMAKNGRDAKPNSLLFWTHCGGGYGHAAVLTDRKDSRGQPIVVTTTWWGKSSVAAIPLDEMIKKLGPFQGWGKP